MPGGSFLTPPHALTATPDAPPPRSKKKPLHSFLLIIIMRRTLDEGKMIVVSRLVPGRSSYT